jgi:hypothetical protein
MRESDGNWSGSGKAGSIYSLVGRVLFVILSNIGLFRSVDVSFSCRPSLVILWMWNFSNVFIYFPFLIVCSICMAVSNCPYVCPVFNVLCKHRCVIVVSYGLYMFSKPYFKVSACLTCILFWTYLAIQLIYATVLIFILIIPRGQMTFYCVGAFKADFDVRMSKEIADVSSYVSCVCKNCQFSCKCMYEA